VEQFQHQDAAAAVHYQQVLAIDPKFENALYNLAIIDTKTAPRTAVNLYGQVIAMFPHDAVARLNLGKLLLSLGQRGAGMAQIHVAVTIEPSLRSQAPS
jgi:hypothetical protein